MIIEIKFDSIQEIAALQRLASSVEEHVLLGSKDSAIMVDAKSFISLFTLDFTQAVEVTTDSLYVIRQLEITARRKAAAR